eukprot:c301_g1_i1.p1 GENE.c301_g1_i1~~c301_g1_i1.p1  ORF type:complete len:307 (-),score=85.93 c301_g1_i1:19-939(-)
MRGIGVVVVLLSLVMSPTFADIHSAITANGSKAVTPSVTNAVLDLIDKSIHQLKSLDGSTFSPLFLNKVQTTQTLSDNTNSEDVPEVARAFGPSYNQTSEFNWNFVGHVLNIREQLLQTNTTHIGPSELTVQVLLGMTIAFVVAMLMFSLSTVISLVQSIYYAIKPTNRPPAISFMQQFFAMMYMIPYSAFYVMMVLMFAVLVVTALLIVQQLVRIFSDTDIINKGIRFMELVRDVVVFFSHVISRYISEDMPTMDQISQLQIQIMRLVAAARALATVIRDSDVNLKSLSQSTTPVAPVSAAVAAA